MSQFQITLIINIAIGLLFVFGLAWFMYKRTNWFIPGGIAYEFFKARKEAKQAAKKSKRDDL